MPFPPFSPDPTRDGHSRPPDGPPSPPDDGNGVLLPDPAARLRQDARQWAETACAATDPLEPDEPTESPSVVVGEGGAGGNAPSAVDDDVMVDPPAPSSSPVETAARERMPRWAPAFLAAYSVEGVIARASDLARVDRSTVRYWRGRSPRFARLMEEAYERSTDLAREEVFRRGVIGWQQPVFFGGQVVGHRVVKSDRCLELLLRSRDPAFRAKVDLSHTSPPGAPVREAREEPAEQLARDREASRMLLDALLAERALREAPAPAVRPAGLLEGPTSTSPVPTSTPAESTVTQCHSAQVPGAGPVAADAPTGKPCPRCAGKPGSVFCTLCHGRGQLV